MAQSHESWWFKRTGVINLALAIGILAIMGLWSFAVPGWAMVVLLAVAVLLSIGLTAKRMRHERRLVHALWQALTGK
jgi:hypothetical protein